ncbi:endonuclease III [Candidatus Dependentiae bacterium HGW-Dependentiae-1]|nr:MAG: endonuclease III [Candidatus Dependentiae bacterium HGW-Dependentiae-1]
MQLSIKTIRDFQGFIGDFYTHNRRDFAWRGVDDPYKVVVSELMLQQTQTHRVAPKFELFVTEFPDFAALASAPLRDVLSLWQGLGYNRRALFLQKSAQKIMAEHVGVLPADSNILVTFPGIGKATAGSICAFAFNLPTVFIETNIRAVFIHSFFRDKEKVSDAEIMPLIEQTLDHENPRDWYYALMDYGVMLKQQCVNPSRKSAHHTTQSRFAGSDRQIRGAIVKLLTNNQSMTELKLIRSLEKDADRVKKIVEQLCSEGFIKRTPCTLEIAE